MWMEKTALEQTLFVLLSLSEQQLPPAKAWPPNLFLL